MKEKDCGLFISLEKVGQVLMPNSLNHQVSKNENGANLDQNLNTVYKWK